MDIIEESNASSEEALAAMRETVGLAAMAVDQATQAASVAGESAGRAEESAAAAEESAKAAQQSAVAAQEISEGAARSEKMSKLSALQANTHVAATKASVQAAKVIAFKAEGARAKAEVARVAAEKARIKVDSARDETVGARDKVVEVIESFSKELCQLTEEKENKRINDEKIKHRQELQKRIELYHQKLDEDESACRSSAIAKQLAIDAHEENKFQRIKSKLLVEVAEIEIKLADADGEDSSLRAELDAQLKAKMISLDEHKKFGSPNFHKMKINEINKEFSEESKRAVQTLPPPLVGSREELAEVTPTTSPTSSLSGSADGTAAPPSVLD